MIEKKQNRRIFLNKALLGIIFMGLLPGCRFNFQSVEFKRGEKAFEEHDYKKALDHYEKVIKAKPDGPLALESARKGARLAHLETNDFLLAIELYRHLVLNSPDDNERLDSQKKIASVYFEKISDYSNSIKEFSRLLNLPHEHKEEMEYRFNIAKSYFYLNNFYQAATEMKEILNKTTDKAERFEYLAFRGNILLTTKKIDEAAEIFKDLIEQYPEESLKQNVQISLAVAFEEKGDFSQAIQVLEKIKKSHPSPEFLELRIKRLRERVLNQPGARGLSK